jgi:hypothetical protein
MERQFIMYAFVPRYLLKNYIEGKDVKEEDVKDLIEKYFPYVLRPPKEWACEAFKFLLDAKLLLKDENGYIIPGPQALKYIHLTKENPLEFLNIPFSVVWTPFAEHSIRLKYNQALRYFNLTPSDVSEYIKQNTPSLLKEKETFLSLKIFDELKKASPSFVLRYIIHIRLVMNSVWRKFLDEVEVDRDLKIFDELKKVITSLVYQNFFNKGFGLFLTTYDFIKLLEQTELKATKAVEGFYPKFKYELTCACSGLIRTFIGAIYDFIQICCPKLLTEQKRNMVFDALKQNDIQKLQQAYEEIQSVAKKYFIKKFHLKFKT